LLDKDMCWHGSASGKQGRRQQYSEAAIQFCLTIKGLFKLAPGQAMGMTQSLCLTPNVLSGFQSVDRRKASSSVCKLTAEPLNLFCREDRILVPVTKWGVVR
jgi:hypothetical protein